MRKSITSKSRPVAADYRRTVMGIHDREYYRGESPSGFDLGGARMMVTNLVIINVAVYILDKFITIGGLPLVYSLAFRPQDLSHPWMWWRFLTAGFAHDPEGINHLLFNMIGLWFIGRDVELKYGSWEFLRFYLLAVVSSSVLGAVETWLRLPADLPQQLWPYTMGASGAVTAVVMLFIFNFPRSTLLLWFIPVPAWLAGILIVGMNLLGTRGVTVPGVTGTAGPQIAFGVHLAGAAFAAAYYFLGINFSRWTTSFRWLSPANWKSRPQLRVHKPDDQYQDLDEECDRLLDKVKQHGIDSLTSKERQKLEAYSRRMQQKLR